MDLLDAIIAGMVALVGRSYESRAIADYLELVGEEPSALVIDGEAGVGKSTLWLAALEQAADHGFHTLSAVTSQAETELEYVTLADLLGDVDPEVFKGLPDVQVAAIDRVLLRGAGKPSATDRQVIPVALMSVIERLSRSSAD